MSTNTLTNTVEQQYDLRPDWMKPGFAEKAKAYNDAYLEDIKNKQVIVEEDDLSEDEDYFYKELYYKNLNTMINGIEKDSQYYTKILIKIQWLDEELHPWNYC